MKDEFVLEDYGWCQIIQRSDKYYIKYDAGGIVIQMKEIEVNKEQVNRAMESQIEAENIIRNNTK